MAERILVTGGAGYIEVWLSRSWSNEVTSQSSSTIYLMDIARRFPRRPD